MGRSIMSFEKEALERQGMLEKVNNLEGMLRDMQSDFEQCARGVSPCFFCANDETCDCSDDKDCHFVWAKHD